MERRVSKLFKACSTNEKTAPMIDRIYVSGVSWLAVFSRKKLAKHRNEITELLKRLSKLPMFQKTIENSQVDLDGESWTRSSELAEKLLLLGEGLEVVKRRDVPNYAEWKPRDYIFLIDLR